MDLKKIVNKGINDLSPYEPGKPIEDLERELGIKNAVKLASNENPVGPSPKVLQSIENILKNTHRYPDGNATKLKEVIGKKFSVKPNQVTIGNGSNDIIEFIARSFLGTDDSAIYSEHAFAVYPLVVKAVGAEGIEVPAKNFSHDLDAMLDSIKSNTKIIFIANPNNPTGTYIPKREVERLVNNIPKNILLVIDSAYSEFVDRPDYTDGSEFVSANNNVVMLRTFSKIYGMGGLRLGWSYAPDSVLDILNRVRSPFNVSYPAIVSGIAALGDDEFLEMSQEHNQKWLKWTSDEIKSLGLTSADSVCNFVVVDFPNNNNLKKTAENADIFLKSKGIIVRRMGGYGLPDSLRITIGLEKEMKYLIESLKIFMSK